MENTNCNNSILIIVHDGVQPVSNGQHCAVTKLCPDGFLDKVIRLHVDRSRSLIQNQDLGLPQQCPGQTNQLSLTNTVKF